MASQFDKLRAQVTGLNRAIATTILIPQNEVAKTTAPAPTGMPEPSTGGGNDSRRESTGAYGT